MIPESKPMTQAMPIQRVALRPADTILGTQPGRFVPVSAAPERGSMFGPRGVWAQPGGPLRVDRAAAEEERQCSGIGAREREAPGIDGHSDRSSSRQLVRSGPRGDRRRRVQPLGRAGDADL